MPNPSQSDDIDFRKEIARELLSLGRTELDDVKIVETSLLPAEAVLTAQLDLEFPNNLAPVPEPIDPKPSTDAPLPKVDIVVVTWTVAEQNGMADVLTPGHSRNTWYRYDRHFDQKYASATRRGSPASNSRRIGSYFLTNIGEKRVLCFKSEFHLNQDGIRNYDGDQTSLPVREMFKQIIEETECSHILTVGTCGGILLEHDLGDVLVTRGARFRCSQEFRNAPFNNTTYISDWEVPTDYFGSAEELMRSFANNLEEPVFGPPTKRHDGDNWTLNRAFNPNIIHEASSRAGRKIDPGHPILTTDFFEFGHSKNANDLWEEGCGVEMGDAVLGLVCQEDLQNPPYWLVIRNISDPQINGELTDTPRALNMQAHWAVWYYQAYGYWTSVMSAITAWSVIAGIK